MTEPLLKVRGLHKAFGAIQACDGIDLDLQAGEIHAVIGPNGAGKTTLVGQIAGEIAPDGGSIQFDGQDVTALPVHARASLGLGRTFQITSVLPAFTAVENVALAAQAKAGHSFRFWRRVRDERALTAVAEACLDQVGLAARRHVSARALAHGEQKQLELAMALAGRPSTLLLDEPTAGTAREDTGRLIELLASLRADHAILLIEHDMDAVFALADRISVLVYGRVIASGPPEDIRRDPEVRAAYLGEEKRLMLELHDIEAGYGDSQVLFGLSLTLAEARVGTLLGRNGMGKTTTIRAVMGLLPTQAGRVIFRGRDITGWPSFRVAQAGIGLVPEGRQIFPNLSLRENLVATARRNGSSHWDLDRIFALFPRLQERQRNMGNQLSGGEQQMLAIARALMTNPALLILDEATEGLAPLIRAEIWQVLAALKDQGLAILVIDKHIEALSDIADHHTIIEKGRAVWSGDSTAFLADHALRDRHLGV